MLPCTHAALVWADFSAKCRSMAACCKGGLRRNQRQQGKCSRQKSSGHSQALKHAGHHAAKCGGLRAAAENTFEDVIFISGFFTNALLAALLVYIGDHLGIDLYYVALLAFGLRIFNNLAMIRRYFLKKH